MEQSASQMVAGARARIENLSPDQVALELATGHARVIDIRERDELDDKGTIPGAIHAPRGMLEFYADSSSPYHREEFDPADRLILVCASGGRSALATETLHRMGYLHVAHLDGGLAAWTAQGFPVERSKNRQPGV
ncbi:MAG TPA: rhodanese-like domain-containing protein [Thermomicrobiales bacterium]|nr:rhodanese-like domain-containing protein [Thermomicrobiales bacterium]